MENKGIMSIPSKYYSIIMTCIEYSKSVIESGGLDLQPVIEALKKEYEKTKKQCINCKDWDIEEFACIKSGFPVYDIHWFESFPCFKEKMDSNNDE